jgi:hypothetical protein
MQNIKSKPQNNASFGVSSSVVPQSESSSTGAATEPRHLPQYSQQYTATDGPGAGSSKHLPTSATSHAGMSSNRTGSSLRELKTGHRHAIHRCHTILQIHRQPRPLSPPKPLVKDWSPFTARQSPRRFAPELSYLVIRSPAGAEHRSHTAEHRRRHRSCCGRRKTLANTATLRSQ